MRTYLILIVLKLQVVCRPHSFGSGCAVLCGACTRAQGLGNARILPSQGSCPLDDLRMPSKPFIYRSVFLPFLVPVQVVSRRGRSWKASTGLQ